MQIKAISGIGPIESGKSVLQPKSTKNFRQHLADLVKKGFSADGILSGREHIDLLQMQKIVQSHRDLSPQQLLTYQIKATGLHFKVELASKASETVSATARRLQQQ